MSWVARGLEVVSWSVKRLTEKEMHLFWVVTGRDHDPDVLSCEVLAPECGEESDAEHCAAEGVGTVVRESVAWLVSEGSERVGERLSETRAHFALKPAVP